MVDSHSVVVDTLAYVGYKSKDYLAWRPLLKDVFGLRRREDSPGDVDQYRLDNRHHRIAVHSSDEDGLGYIGWEVATAEHVQAFAKKLEGLGIDYEWASDELAYERTVSSLIRFKGPDDLCLEVCAGLATDFVPFVPAAPRVGYLTEDLGLGHATIAVGDLAFASRWYRDVFGFNMADVVNNKRKNLLVHFMYCNGRHHSFAMAQAVPGFPPGSMNHLLLEAMSLGDVGRGHDVMLEKGYPLSVTLGQHSNDLMFSFYAYMPSGTQIEYGYGGLVLDEEKWRELHFHSGDLWGHKYLPREEWPFPSGEIHSMD